MENSQFSFDEDRNYLSGDSGELVFFNFPGPSYVYFCLDMKRQPNGA